MNGETNIREVLAALKEWARFSAGAKAARDYDEWREAGFPGLDPQTLRGPFTANKADVRLWRAWKAMQ